MVIKKQELMGLLDQLPEDVDIESLIGQLYLKAKLDRAEQDIAVGRTRTHEQLLGEIQQWGK